MHILLIEDDPRLTSVLVRTLSEVGWSVSSARDGVEGARLIKSASADALVLDLGLPGRSGLELLADLRSEGSSLPVLVLTGRDTVGDRVKGLDAGADDYLTKPFALEELLARLRALLRRGGGSDPVLRYADLELDPGRGTVARGGQRLDLRPREYELLEYFMRNPDRVLSRMQLYEHVWGYRYDGSSNVLEVYVRYLRTKLEANGVRLIHTQRGRGYTLRRPEDS